MCSGQQDERAYERKSERVHVLTGNEKSSLYRVLADGVEVRETQDQLAAVPLLVVTGDCHELHIGWELLGNR